MCGAQDTTEKTQESDTEWAFFDLPSETEKTLRVQSVRAYKHHPLPGLVKAPLPEGSSIWWDFTYLMLRHYDQGNLFTTFSATLY